MNHLHRHHLVCIAAAAGIAVWLLLAGNGGLAVAGVSLALLVCPLVMGVVMWLLMRQPPAATQHRDTDTHDTDAHDTRSTPVAQP